jgi:hypothetical protein
MRTRNRNRELQSERPLRHESRIRLVKVVDLLSSLSDRYSAVVHQTEYSVERRLLLISTADMLSRAPVRSPTLELGACALSTNHARPSSLAYLPAQAASE